MRRMAGILYTHWMRMDTDRRMDKCRRSVGDYRIITEGLKSGDEVVLQ